MLLLIDCFCTCTIPGIFAFTAMSTKSSVDYTGTPGSANLSPISQTSPISMSPLSPGTSPLSSEVNSPIAGAVGKDVVRKIHSRRFRE
jgi:hypothetical protein